MEIIAQQKIRNTLETLGLTSQEVTVYLEMLSLGSVPVSVVAKRLKLTRSTIRYTLEKLAKKKLLIESRKNKTFYYTPEDPERIIRVLRDKKAEIDYQEAAIGKILPDLKSLQSPFKNVPKVQYFEGEEGLIVMYEDVLKSIEQEPLTIFSYAKVLPGHVYPVAWKYLKEVYNPRRAAVGNQAFMILPENMLESEYVSFNKKLNRTCAYVPDSEFDFLTGFHVYGDKVAHYFQNQQDQIGGVLIENPSIAQDQKQLFTMAWKYALTLKLNTKLSHLELPRF